MMVGKNILRWLTKPFRRKSYGEIPPRTSLVTKATGEKFKHGQWMYREVQPIGTPWWRTYPQEEMQEVSHNPDSLPIEH